VPHAHTISEVIAPRRLVQLVAGLILYGITDAMILGARLGADPWDVFHQGLSRRTGLSVGTCVIVVGVVVLLLWIPLRQRPGIGTLCNVVGIGAVINVALPLMPRSPNLATSVALLVSAVVLNGVATGAYIGAGLGPGPRDGLMTGYAARGHSIRVVRTAIELTVVAAGFVLGGTVGIGTLVYAVSIGPLTHIFLPLLTIDPRKQGHPRAVPARGDAA
jgi:uncharacterized membrane protein YczE